MTSSRVPAGVPTGGQFALGVRSESPVRLAPDSEQGRHTCPNCVGTGVYGPLPCQRCSGLGSEIDSDQFEDRQPLTPGPIARFHDPDSNIMHSLRDDCLDAGSFECRNCRGKGLNVRWGGQHVDVCEPCDGRGWNPPTPAGLDQVDVAGRRFTRVRNGVYGNEPFAMRFEANRPLKDSEIQHLAQLIGYDYASTVRGEPMDWPDRDSDRSFIVAADTTKTRSDDLSTALGEFEVNLGQMIQEGSPVRQTDRAGRGTAGTRLVEGLDDPGLQVEIFYDSVVQS